MRYVTEPGYLDVSKIDDGDPDNDAEALLTAAVGNNEQRTYFGEMLDQSPATWRMTRRGHVIY
jgi:hypothetical protein